MPGWTCFVIGCFRPQTGHCSKHNGSRDRHTNPAILSEVNEDLRERSTRLQTQQRRIQDDERSRSRRMNRRCEHDSLSSDEETRPQRTIQRATDTKFHRRSSIEAQEQRSVPEAPHVSNRAISPTSRLLRPTTTSALRSRASSLSPNYRYDHSQNVRVEASRPSTSLSRSQPVASTPRTSPLERFNQYGRSQTYRLHPGSRTRESLGLSR